MKAQDIFKFGGAEGTAGSAEGRGAGAEGSSSGTEQGSARWLDDQGPSYKEFTRGFVTPRQSVFHLNGNAKGSEQFGMHVATPRLAATPSGDGESPGEQQR